MLIFIGYTFVWSLIMGKQQPKPLAQQNQQEPADKKDAADKPADAEKPANAEKPAEPGVREANPPEAAPQPETEPPLQWFTLGSANPDETKNPYRLLVTATNAGAAIVRVELASSRFRDLERRGGYMGHLGFQDAPTGVQINVVGPGTPAADAGLLPGDVLLEFNQQQITDSDAFAKRLEDTTRPGQEIELKFSRGGQVQTASVTLGRYPLEVVRPEVLADGTQIPRATTDTAKNHDPFSFLFTLWQLDKDKLPSDAKLDDELPDVALRKAHWDGKQIDAETIEFTRPLPKVGLEAVKRYRIAKIEAGKPAYHLTLEVELRNTGKAERHIAYQLDGPTGLPTEGWWFASRISPEWGGAGVRNTVLMMQGKPATLMSPMQIGDNKLDPPFRWEDAESLLTYAGVDAQYFACALMPNPQTNREPWLAQIKPILAGTMPTERVYRTLGNVTCRFISTQAVIEPKGKLVHTYTVFAGPKQPDLLAQYPLDATPGNSLGELIYYGWPMWAMVARLMTHVLHFFYSIVGNYGIAIIMLTVLVRGCMFPLSRKQALGAQKMQLLKPEMDRINEKYKGKNEEKARAMQELYRKHGFNPMSGCMLAVVQLPIFMGLYRSLMINVELRQAPLISEAVRWCSNLAAPDMLFRWADWSAMPSFLTAYKGFMSLGPYLNILPIFTVGLMILQQQMFMPPATDEQTQMQQKMMKYMMILIGYAFYTVPSGLCLYIISSSLWGIAEKKLLPKTIKTNGAPAAATRAVASVDGNGAAARRNRKKQRGGK
jgi:YidC/Oxa1 family membrane protein insertase